MVWTVQFVSSTSVKDENGRRRDADERRELFCGSVDILLLYRRIFVNCEVRNGEGCCRCCKGVLGQAAKVSKDTH
ncbi:hypothetical protein M758_10G133600 [Ceratodon purpureus]|uniref:Uncharacterized protein n=1 Tax=Ceratodon purpureus TaxID=3225 RepID=A0A8T0GNT7_CERPU|nr:hypothetical protein KC19_10G138300 [Ceratodon purpureus]KAG0603956.1 hypothetical protein M758_10G133600 [Ceratodon purpureus]